MESDSELDLWVKNYNEKIKEMMGACMRQVACAWVACVSSTDFSIGGFYDPNSRFLFLEKCFYDLDDWFLWLVVRWDALDSISGCLEFYARWVLCPWYRGSMPGYWWIANFKSDILFQKSGFYVEISWAYICKCHACMWQTLKFERIRTLKAIGCNVYDLLLEFLWLPSMTSMTVLFL